MAQANLIPLNKDEAQLLHSCFDIFKATQSRAANNAKNDIVKDAYTKSAKQIQALEVKVFSFIAE